MLTNMLSIVSNDQTRPIRMVQITDTHLFEDPKTCFLGMNTENSFQSVIELIKQEHSLQNPKEQASIVNTVLLIIATGDIAQTPSATTYARFLDRMKTLEQPCIWLQGNHDLNHLLLETPQQQANKNLIELGQQWLVIMLNSSNDHETEGAFSSKELNWLTEQLKSYPDRHIIVALHHNPLKINSTWLDQCGLSNANEFWEVIDSASQVKAVIHGHVHQVFEATRGSIQIWSCPSTCIQFKPNSETFSVDILPPGYRWFDLYHDGRIESGVSRISRMPEGLDFNSQGY
ncbi:MAG: 3',5'-cyclic-AMP phosphodiesterase [Candidatus Saccharibacteria bacterium]|nr:3',5'-cyclic-AMP phosphodiesterase [Moraxellaceae bacterium]